MKYASIAVIIFALLLSLEISSCKNEKHHYQLAAANRGTSNFQAGELIANQLENETGIHLELIDSCYGSVDNLTKIMEGQADFAIIQNSLNYHSLQYSEEEINRKLRTIIPLYSQILFIIYPDSIKHGDIFELFEDKRVGMGPKEGGTAWLVKKILRYFNLDTTQYTPVYTSYVDNKICKEIDISCSVTSFNNPRIIEMMKQPELKLFSLDKPGNITFNGSVANGISLKNTTLTPFVIPKYTYSHKPDKPILTISTKGVLVCRSELDEDLIYNITQTIVENKTLIVNQDPIFKDIREEIKTDDLRFPLHAGVRMYLDRSKPGFLVKYAEVFALIFSILVVLYGAFSSLQKWNKSQKKDRIDVYYQRIIDLDKPIQQANTKTELLALEKELMAIRNKAFDLLIGEKLSADESFHIFLRILEVSMERIQQKMK